LRIAEAAGVQREHRRAWAASAAVVLHTDPRVVAARHSALQTILAVRRGGLGADAAIAIVDRLISAGAANLTHIELVARGACFTTAEVLDLVARSAAAGVDMSQGTAARLAECVVVEAGTEADKARHFFEQAAATTTATPAIATKVHAALALLNKLAAKHLEKLRLDSLRNAFERGARGYDAATALFDGWCSARGRRHARAGEVCDAAPALFRARARTRAAAGGGCRRRARRRRVRSAGDASST
jgi:hypothetical protein